MGWVLDLDGVVWLGSQPIPGAAGAVARLRDVGEEVLFVTNNSSPTVAEQEAKLARLGIDGSGLVVTSAVAAAALVEPGERVLVAGGAGVREALERRGADPVSAGPAEAVMIGFDPDFDYARLRLMFEAVRGGARLIATNPDATFPTPDGPIPGGGSIAAAVAYASGVQPLVAGKPNQPMADLIRHRLGPHGTMVGDRPDTDGRFARVLGYRWALVLSGVTRADDLPVDPEPDLIAADLAALVDGAAAAPRRARGAQGVWGAAMPPRDRPEGGSADP